VRRADSLAEEALGSHDGKRTPTRGYTAYQILAGHFIIDAVAVVGDRAAKFFFPFGASEAERDEAFQCRVCFRPITPSTANSLSRVISVGLN
jgi:hypothetical protein